MKAAVSRLAQCCKGLAAFAIVSGSVPGARAQDANSFNYTVRLDDLDLSTARGQLDAHRRLSSAARRVCETIVSPFERASARAQCAEEVADAATPQLTQRIAQAQIRTQPNTDPARFAQERLPAAPSETELAEAGH